MTLPSSPNQISMKDILDEKQGSTTARTNVSLKGLSVDGTADSSGGDITGTPDGNAPYAISEFHGYTQITDAFPASGESSWFQQGGLGGDAPESQWGNRSHSDTGFVQVFTNLGFKNITSPASGLDHISMRWTTADSSAASSFTFSEIDYTGHESTTFQAKCDYSVTQTGATGFGISVENPASYSPASGTFANVSTSTYSPVWQWSIEHSSSSAGGTTSLSSAGGTNPDWTVRAGGSGASTISGPSRSINLSATRGTGGGGGGGFICIHEDHLVQTEDGLMHVDDLVENAPRVWSYDRVNQENVLSRLRRVEIRTHNNLYRINDMMVTEDHVLYKENYNPVSVNPTASEENYNINAAEIQVGDRLMKFDGSLEEVTSIERYEGEHRTYTLCTERDNNFFADGILVDSEIRL